MFPLGTPGAGARGYAICLFVAPGDTKKIMRPGYFFVARTMVGGDAKPGGGGYDNRFVKGQSRGVATGGEGFSQPR